MSKPPPFCEYLISKNCHIININNKIIDMSYLFSKCSDELKLKIKSKVNMFKEEAFEDYDAYED